VIPGLESVRSPTAWQKEVLVAKASLALAAVFSEVVALEARRIVWEISSMLEGTVARDKAAPPTPGAGVEGVLETRVPD